MQKYENKYALSRLTITSPRILARLKEFNKKKDYQRQIKPYNFSILGFSNALNENTDELIKPLAPFRKPAKCAVHDYFVDYNDKTAKKLKGKEYWKSFWDTFREYLNHPESKFDGDIGVLKRKHIVASRVVHIGKESNNLDEAEFLGVESGSYEIYEDLENVDSKFKKIVEWILTLQPKVTKKIGISRQTLWNIKKKIKLNQINRISISIKIRFLELNAGL